MMATGRLSARNLYSEWFAQFVVQWFWFSTAEPWTGVLNHSKTFWIFEPPCPHLTVAPMLILFHAISIHLHWLEPSYQVSGPVKHFKKIACYLLCPTQYVNVSEQLKPGTDRTTGKNFSEAEKTEASEIRTAPWPHHTREVSQAQLHASLSSTVNKYSSFSVRKSMSS